MFMVMVRESTLGNMPLCHFAAEIMDDDEGEPPTGSLTTDETEGDLHLLDSLPPERTEQLSTPAPS